MSFALFPVTFLATGIPEIINTFPGFVCTWHVLFCFVFFPCSGLPMVHGVPCPRIRSETAAAAMLDP